MTKTEFTDWTEVKEGSKQKWVLDLVRWVNYKEIRYYKGKAEGKFLWIYPDGQLQLGTYQGAIPYIMAALFQPIFSKKFEDQSEAYKRILDVGGVQFRVETVLSGSFGNRS